jgi:FMN-dependent oxidoreductase (nitrilotriacetate monooxygenase family)
MSKTRQMALVGFLQAQNCSNYVGSWRHPGSATDFLGVEYYQRIARALEHGKFHMCFFDDRLAMPDILGDSHIEAVRNGVRVVKMDPCTILTCMGMATKNLGLGSTYSTTYYEPFHVARVFATLDLMVGGRAAWNVVTSLNSSEAQNFGEAEHPEHDLRYDKADEFMEVVLGHWDSWEDDAIVVDKDTGLFAHAEKVHKLGHHGRWFRSKGPFTVPRSPQGRPVIIQAGQSGRGRDFAARWGELVFCVYSSVEMGRKQYKAFKDQLAGYGRDPDSVRVCPATYIIAGETQSMAEDKRALIDKMAKPIDALALLSEALNFDFASKPMDQPFTDEELKNISGLRGILDRVILLSGNKNPSLGDFVKYSKRGTIGEHPCFCGNAKQVADQLEEWFNNCCDGFVFAATELPGTYEDIARYVVPELQRRGLHHMDYKGPTLRDNLGLPKAEIGDWRLKS